MSPRSVAPLIGRAATIVIAALALALVVVTLVIPRVTGGASLTVLSGSMTPTYPVGSVVVVLPVEPAEVEQGDVITFYKSPTSKSLTTHRVVDIRRDMSVSDEATLSFTTRGDANDTNDREPIPAEAVRGRVWFHVPWIGTLRDNVMSVPGLLVLAALAAGIGLHDRLPIGSRSGASPSGRRESVSDSHSADAHKAGAGRTHETLAAPATEIQVLVVRVATGRLERRDLLDLLQLFGGTVVALGPAELVVTVTASPSVLDHFAGMLEVFDVRDAVRSEAVRVPGVAIRAVPAHGPSAGTSDQPTMPPDDTLLPPSVILPPHPEMTPVLPGDEHA